MAVGDDSAVCPWEADDEADDDDEGDAEEEAEAEADGEEDWPSEAVPCPVEEDEGEAEEDDDEVDDDEADDEDSWAVGDGDSSDAVGDGEDVLPCVGCESSDGVTLREEFTMSLTTESVPRPRVTSSTTPADRSVATRALTTATTIAVRRVRAARDFADAVVDRPDEDPRMMRVLAGPAAASAGLDATIRGSKAPPPSGTVPSAASPSFDSVGSPLDGAALAREAVEAFAAWASNRVVAPPTSTVPAGAKFTPSAAPLRTIREPAVEDVGISSAPTSPPSASRRPRSAPRDPDPSEEAAVGLSSSWSASPPSDGEASWSFLDDSLRTFW